MAKAKVLIGVQSDVDTEATEYKRLKATSFGLKRNVEKTDSKEWNETGYKADSWVMKVNSNGDIGVESTIDQFETLLPSLGYVAPDSRGTGPKVFKATTGGINKYLTVILEDKGGKTYEKYTGVLLNSFKINVAVAQPVNLTLGCLGIKSDVKNGGSSKESTEFDGKKLICLGTTVTDNSNDVTKKMQSVDIEFSNSLKVEDCINSVYGKGIAEDGMKSIKVSFDYNEFEGTNFVSASDGMLNNSNFTVKVEFKEQGTNNKITFEFHKCAVSNVERQNLESVQTMKKELEALYDATNNTPVTITITKA